MLQGCTASHDRLFQSCDLRARSVTTANHRNSAQLSRHISECLAAVRQVEAPSSDSGVSWTALFAKMLTSQLSRHASGGMAFLFRCSGSSANLSKSPSVQPGAFDSLTAFMFRRENRFSMASSRTDRHMMADAE